MSNSPRVAACSWAAVARAPLTQARLRPSRCTVRRTTSSLPAAGNPRVSSLASQVVGSRGRNSAWTSASSAPVRTESACARPPSTRCSASTRMLLPAPVSPVRTLNPGSKCTSSSSMMANARTRSSSSMPGKIADGSDIGGTLRAMFEPGDPRYQEILDLANLATRDCLPDGRRQRWRELVTQLLGSIQSQGGIAERRHHLRADAELEVDILAPDEMASLATSTVGSGGLSIRIAEVVPSGTPIDLSIKVPQRKVPLLVTAQVVWSRPGELGAAFVGLFQNDRELLEGIAVKALLEAG